MSLKQKCTDKQAHTWKEIVPLERPNLPVLPTHLPQGRDGQRKKAPDITPGRIQERMMKGKEEKAEMPLVKVRCKNCKWQPGGCYTTPSDLERWNGRCPYQE